MLLKKNHITRIGKITKFEINYQEHSSFYDFYDSLNVVEEFLFNVKNKIKRSKVEFFIKSGFSLENIQPVLDQYNEPLKNSRYSQKIRSRQILLTILFISTLENQY